MGKAPLGMRFSWDDKKVGVQVLMSQIVGDGAKGVFIKDADEYCRDIQKPSKALYTPGGLVYLDEWGSIRYAMNSAFACIMVSDLSDDPHKARRYHKWSQSQIDYVLGAKNNGFSFMVGFGKKYPLSVGWESKPIRLAVELELSHFPTLRVDLIIAVLAAQKTPSKFATIALPSPKNATRSSYGAQLSAGLTDMTDTKVSFRSFHA